MCPGCDRGIHRLHPALPIFAPTIHEQPSCTPTTLSSLSLEDEGLVPASTGTDLAEREPKDPEDVLHDMPAEVLTQPFPRNLSKPAADDISVEREPSRHVDYLSYKWQEEDIWASWRYVTARKTIYSDVVRLENASWRAWAKAKYSLSTIAPEKLNWLKDCDVIWLYGPLKKSSNNTTASDASPLPSYTGTPSSYVYHKPILKKKTASETILQRSLSQRALLQHASAILKAQEAEKGRVRTPLDRTVTELDHFQHRTGSSSCSLRGTLTATSSSGIVTPGERRHIHFNNQVAQCIAVEAKEEDEVGDEWLAAFEDESSDEGAVMLSQLLNRASICSHSMQCSSFSGELKSIAPLPPTTLRYRGDVPQTQTDSIECQSSVIQSSSMPSSTASVEMLRPPQRSADHLLDEEDGAPIFDSQFASDDDNRYQSWFSPYSTKTGGDEDEDGNRRLPFTASGMFMPFDEGEAASTSILGQALDMVNIARDIAYVIWNVGW